MPGDRLSSPPRPASDQARAARIGHRLQSRKGFEDTINAARRRDGMPAETTGESSAGCRHSCRSPPRPPAEFEEASAAFTISWASLRMASR
jgi:hypothetical protein